MSLFHDIAALFFPPRCAACGKPLSPGETLLCNHCRWEIPLTRHWEHTDNPLAQRLREHLPIENAVAFFYFTHQSPFRSLIHDFKYRGHWRTACRMGRWFGTELAPSLTDIDIIIPVPLHLLRRLRRGYNQSEQIARGIASSLPGCPPVDTRTVLRTTYTPSQATRTGEERWDNVVDIFRVRTPQTIADRHILLVDDVLTTGATTLSLAQTILKASPSTRISIAALATTTN